MSIKDELIDKIISTMSDVQRWDSHGTYDVDTKTNSQVCIMGNDVYVECIKLNKQQGEKMKQAIVDLNARRAHLSNLTEVSRLYKAYGVKENE